MLQSGQADTRIVLIQSSGGVRETEVWVFGMKPENDIKYMWRCITCDAMTVGWPVVRESLIGQLRCCECSKPLGEKDSDYAVCIDMGLLAVYYEEQVV